MRNKTNNLTAKIVSLIVAFLLWSYVMGVENPSEYRTFRNIMVNFANMESLGRKQLELMDPGEVYISVRVSGKKRDLERLTQDNIIASVDLEGYSAGETRIPIDVKLRSSLETVEIVSYTPSDVVVNIDRVVSREMDVRIVPEGHPAENFVLGELQSSMPKVAVKGPSSLVNRVRKLETYLSIEGRKESFTVSTPVVAYDDDDEKMSNVHITPQTVDVTVPIYKTFILPVGVELTGKYPENYAVTEVEITPPTVSLKALGDAAPPQKIMTQPMDRGKLVYQNEMPLQLIIPDGFALVDPKVVYKMRYRVHVFAKKKVSINSKQIQFVGVPEHLRIDEQTMAETYEVILRAYEDTLSDLNVGTLVFECDASHIAEGKNTAALSMHDANHPDLSMGEPLSISFEAHRREEEETPTSDAP